MKTEHPPSSFRDARRPRDATADTLAPARGTNARITSRSMTSAGSLEVRDDVVARSRAELGNVSDAVFEI